MQRLETAKTQQMDIDLSQQMRHIYASMASVRALANISRKEWEMNSSLHWTSYVTAIAIPIIALVAAWIAFRQSQLARRKLKLDLFDKRMEVYEAVRTALGTAARSGKLTNEQEIEYLLGVRSAKWLFGPDVYEYLDKTLWHKIVDLGLHNSMMEGPRDNESTKHIHARADTIKWLVAQYQEFDKLCAKYLRLEH